MTPPNRLQIVSAFVSPGIQRITNQGFLLKVLYFCSAELVKLSSRIWVSSRSASCACEHSTKSCTRASAPTVKPYATPAPAASSSTRTPAASNIDRSNSACGKPEASATRVIRSPAVGCDSDGTAIPDCPSPAQGKGREHPARRRGKCRARLSAPSLAARA